MTSPIPTRFSDEEVGLIDDLVARGVAPTRSAVIRRGIHELAELERRIRIGETIASSYREVPQTAEDDGIALANALALTDAEPW